MSCFLKAVLGSGLTLLLAALLLPQYSDYRARAETDGWLAWVVPLQGEIEAEMLRRVGSPGPDGLAGIARAVHSPGERPASLSLLTRQDTGEIRMKGGIDGQMLILTPTLSAGKVVWHCLGAPDRAMPAPCRGGPARLL